MHVRWDWAQLIDHDGYKSVSALCGKKTSRHLVGIPGITEQPRMVARKDGTPRLGWCPTCLSALAFEIPDDKFLEGTIEPVRDAHMIIRRELIEIADVMTGYFKPRVDQALSRKAT